MACLFVSSGAIARTMVKRRVFADTSRASHFFLPCCFKASERVCGGVCFLSPFQIMALWLFLLTLHYSSYCNRIIWSGIELLIKVKLWFTQQHSGMKAKREKNGAQLENLNHSRRLFVEMSRIHFNNYSIHKNRLIVVHCTAPASLATIALLARTNWPQQIYIISFASCFFFKRLK